MSDAVTPVEGMHLLNAEPIETWPMAYAIVSTVNPNAKETPRSPIPTAGKPAESTALPQPPRTSQKVPMNSAESFGNIAMPFTKTE